MSVDQTITELSGTLAQLSTLVAHINGQISGITGRINLTLDNFDQAVANLAKDAGSVTYQVGNTVSQSILFSIDLGHEKASQVCIHRSVCVSSNITVFAWSRTNKWAEFRVLMSQVD
uniref:Uncharacterized protein n=1 Tax=Caenorhabditis japonica TaxID=281687 RepID=A0A8R1EQG0_CAEJA